MSRTLYLAGFQKCGTDTLYGLLAALPEMRASVPKETHHHALAPAAREAEAYAAAFPSGTGPRLDASASYAVVERAVDSLAATGDPARFVFVVRPHAQRVWSSYLHMCKASPAYDRRGFDEAVPWHATDLDTALAAEREGIARAGLERRIDLDSFRAFGDDADWNFRYLANTCYARHVGRFVERFGREAVHVESLAALTGDPHGTLRRIAAFTGVSYGGDDVAAVERNRTLLPSANLLGRLLARRGLRDLGRRMVPSALRRRIKERLVGIALERPPALPDEAAAALEALFAPDRRDLALLLGSDPLAPA